VFGDSTALQTSWGLLVELTRTQRGEFVPGFTGLGCSVVRTAQRRIASDVESSDATCNGWADVWKVEVDRSRPDVVVVQTGSWDVADRIVPGLVGADADRWRSPGDPSWDAFALSEMVAAVDVLSSTGAVVVWLTSPAPGPIAYRTPRVAAFDPAPRHRRFNELVRQLPGLRSGQVAVVDLAAWVASRSPDEDARLRPDGVHFSHDASVEVCSRFLCNEVLQEARQLRPGPPSSAVPPTTAPLLRVPTPTEPDARRAAQTTLVGQTLPAAGLAAAQAGWRVRVDADETFDTVPAADDELVMWWWTGTVNEIR
jgi:lysophospholipase L1-like esterase